MFDSGSNSNAIRNAGRKSEAGRAIATGFEACLVGHVRRTICWAMAIGTAIAQHSTVKYTRIGWIPTTRLSSFESQICENRRRIVQNYARGYTTLQKLG